MVFTAAAGSQSARALKLLGGLGLQRLQRVVLASWRRADNWGAGMKIGIIGAGNIGVALASRLVQLGHEVSIANSLGRATPREAVAETRSVAVEVRDAAR